MSLGPLTQFHENPRLIAWWQARLAPLLDGLTPTRRRWLLALAAVVVCFRKAREYIGETVLPVPQDQPGLFLVVAVLLALSWLIYRAAASYASLPRRIRAHPQLTLHGLYWGMLVLLWNTTPQDGRWREVFVAVALIFPFMIWRFGYVLISGQFGRMGGTRFSDHLLTLWPVYGGTNTPYGNGLGYLSRSEAKNSEQLARAQLAGIKLLLLAVVLRLVKDVFMGCVYGSGNHWTERLGGLTLAIPRLEQQIAEGGEASAGLGWLAIYCELINQVLRHAIRGHEIIGVLRLFGFNVFRNTYKPLLSESIIEFWNRYYFYFKELIANFFFLPTFSQLGSRLRNWPRLRLFIAVFAAAFIGNTYYHLIHSNEAMVFGAVFDSLYAMRSRIFYCFLLALGISISMLREQGRGGKAPPAGRLHRLRRIAGVWTFFGLIFIWHGTDETGFATRVQFFLGLFGLA